MARLTTLLIVIIALFSAIAVWEWIFYLRATPIHGVVHRARASADGESSGAVSAQAGRNGLPRTAVTGLQALVDADQLPLAAAAADSRGGEHGGSVRAAALGGEVLPVQLVPALPNAAVILFCYNRAGYLKQTLDSLAQLPGLQDVTVYISQDGNDSEVTSLAFHFAATRLRPPRTRGAEHWQHPREALLNEQQPSHAWLSQHYRWGLARLFEERKHSHAIILEDDMLFSPDFLLLFKATAPLLEADPTLWCVSSWNDNGLSHLEWHNERLFRTSYFPGLGWMIRQQLWGELGPRFPLQAWDHWMRLDNTSRGRDCISVEVNRNKNIGERGANMQRSMFKRYLARMLWSQTPVQDWGDLSYLRLGAYEQHLQELVDRAELWEQPLTASNIRKAGTAKVWLVAYLAEEYAQLARVLQIWPFPRGHHRHLNVLRYQGSTFLLADRRFCPFLPARFRVLPDQSLRAIAGPVGVDCDTVCRGAGMACQAEDFWFINSCSELAKHFPCQKGCAVELGSDVPNYVTGPHLPTFQTCLTTQSKPKCSAAHPHTQRLCPCVTMEQLLAD